MGKSNDLLRVTNCLIEEVTLEHRSSSSESGAVSPMPALSQGFVVCQDNPFLQPPPKNDSWRGARVPQLVKHLSSDQVMIPQLMCQALRQALC